MSFGLVLLGVAFTVAAVALRDPPLLFLALPILIAPLAAAAGPPSVPGPVRLSWELSGSGAEIEIAGRLEGAAPGSADSMRLEFVRPGPILEERPPELDAAETRLNFRLSWKAPYPLLETLPVPRVILEDPIGLAEREVRVIGAPILLERFPPEASRIGSVPLRRTTALPGEVASRSIGAAGSFFGVRLAVPGDSPRRINWRASARTGRECVNEFLLDRTGDLLIVLDARPTGLGLDRDRASSQSVGPQPTGSPTDSSERRTGSASPSSGSTSSRSHSGPVGRTDTGSMNCSPGRTSRRSPDHRNDSPSPYGERTPPGSPRCSSARSPTTNPTISCRIFGGAGSRRSSSALPLSPS